MSAIIRCARVAEARGAYSRVGLVARVVVPFHHQPDGVGNKMLLPTLQLNTASSRALHVHRASPSAVASVRAAVTDIYAPYSNAAAATAVLPRGQHAANFHGSSSSSSSSSGSGEEQKNNTSHTAPTTSPGKNTVSSYMLFHPQYDMSKIADIKPAHRPPAGIRDWISFGAVQFARSSFDRVTGYAPDKRISREQWLTRFIFLETVAGVPGMVAAMLRHMISLRTLKRDHGWIHTLLEEAENERMHLLTFMCLKNPGIGFRLAVLSAQGIFFNAFLAAYIITPRTCHRFVGYLEEEAVKTYTHALHDIDVEGSDAAIWASTPAPEIAVQYWRLAPDATVRDVVMAVRADEVRRPGGVAVRCGGTLQQRPFLTPPGGGLFRFQFFIPFSRVPYSVSRVQLCVTKRPSVSQAARRSLRSLVSRTLPHILS